MDDNKHRPESWPAAAAGAFFFLLTGIVMMSGDIPRAWTSFRWLPAIDSLFWFGLVVPAVAFIFGWVQGFPRWSYPYVGGLLVNSLYMMSTATPLLRRIGYLNQGWGYKAWIPFLLALLVGVLVSRSLQPLRLFFRNMRRDWTLASFLMLAWMPHVIGIHFDEVDRLYAFSLELLLTLLMVATALFYMRAASQASRSLALGVGITSSLLITVLGSIIYWQPLGGVYIPGALVFGLVILLVMLAPIWIASHASPAGGERGAQI